MCVDFGCTIGSPHSPYPYGMNWDAISQIEVGGSHL